MAGESTGWGSEFHLHNGVAGVGGALTLLVGVFEVTPPSDEADDVKVTHFKSAGRSHEYIRGMIETGEIEVKMNYVPGSATDVLCRGAQATGDTRTWKIIVPKADGTPAWSISGSAYAKKYEREIPLDDRLTATLTLKVSGAVTEAVPA